MNQSGSLGGSVCFSFFSTISLYFFSFSFPFCRVFFFFGLLIQLVFQYIMADSLFSSTPAPPLYLNMNINLNPETMVHVDIYIIKYRQC